MPPHTDPGFPDAYGSAWSGTDDAPLLAHFAEDGEYTDTGSSITVRGHTGIARFRRAMFAFSRDSRSTSTLSPTLTLGLPSTRPNSWMGTWPSLL